ncbi:VWA domain-containing protein [Deltaproteobacteria bacterium TL4]
MRKQNKNIIVILVLIFAGGYFVWDQIYLKRSLSYEDAVSKLSRLLKRVDWSEQYVQRRAKVTLGKKKDLEETLPDIQQFEVVVDPRVSEQEVVVEIFASTEKSGSGNDGWIVDVAKGFNTQSIQLSNGQKAKVRIRKIASGTGYQFIAYRKYLPDAFSPSNQLWIQMAAAHDIPMNVIRQSLVGNIAGVIMKTAVADQLRESYGQLNLKNLIDAVVQGNLAMGYTDPFASSTGLNFLISVLNIFAEGEEKNMLNPSVVSAFEGFQRGVPFISQTTLQMRESVQNDGSLEAFVMEYQTYIKVPELQSGYEFIPFGVRHDNPLYALGHLSKEKQEALEAFATFAEQSRYQQLARKYGFFPPLNYEASFEAPSGRTLIQAQELWKGKKDSGQPIAAIFLCDTSGSMGGSRIKALQGSLLSGSEFIDTNNAIGLVFFNNTSSVVLPIATFNLNQKATFRAAVEDMQAGGGTAMYDGLVVSLSLLVEEKRKNPNIKLRLFVLTDGETDLGLSFEQIRNVVEGLKIPIYTIGYEANLEVLKKLSSIVEAASLNADEGEIEYKIGSLLNAQM